MTADHTAQVMQFGDAQLRLVNGMGVGLADSYAQRLCDPDFRPLFAFVVTSQHTLDPNPFTMWHLVSWQLLAELAGQLQGLRESLLPLEVVEQWDQMAAETRDRFVAQAGGMRARMAIQEQQLRELNGGLDPESFGRG